MGDGARTQSSQPGVATTYSVVGATIGRHKRSYTVKAEEVGQWQRRPSVSYSMTVRMRGARGGTAVSQLTTAVESAGGSVTGLDVTASGHDKLRIDVTIAAGSTSHADEIAEQLRGIEGVSLGKVSDRTFLMHLGGKIEMASKHPIRNRDDLSMIYTPGVARVCMAIDREPRDARRPTIKRNPLRS